MTTGEPIMLAQGRAFSDATRRSHWNSLWWSALRYPRESLTIFGADLRDPSFGGHVETTWAKNVKTWIDG